MLGIKPPALGTPRNASTINGRIVQYKSRVRDELVAVRFHIHFLRAFLAVFGVVVFMGTLLARCVFGHLSILRSDGGLCCSLILGDVMLCLENVVCGRLCRRCFYTGWIIFSARSLMFVQHYGEGQAHSSSFSCRSLSSFLSCPPFPPRSRRPEFP